MKTVRVFANHREWILNNLDSVATEIKAMDGEQTSLVMFILDDGSAQLAVAGGNDGRYIVDITYGITDAFYSLQSGAPEGGVDDEIEVISGGQAVTCSPSRIVDRATAIQAARYWAEFAKMDPSLKWKRTGVQN